MTTFNHPNTIHNDLDLLCPPLHNLVINILADIQHHRLPFKVFETGRTIERQEFLLDNGKTTIIDSKHLIEVDKNNNIIKKSEAVDFVIHYSALNGSNIWSWANIGNEHQKARDMAYYRILKELIMTKYSPLIESDPAIKQIESGGDWENFKDWPHYQIDLV